MMNAAERTSAWQDSRERVQAPAPDPKLIPKGDIVGVTVILLTCSYREAVCN
jgi:hypothetical protein